MPAGDPPRVSGTSAQCGSLALGCLCQGLGSGFKVWGLGVGT